MIEFYENNDIHGDMRKRWIVIAESKLLSLLIKLDEFWKSLSKHKSLFNFLKFYFLSLIKGYFVIEDHCRNRLGNMEIILRFGTLRILAGVYLERVPVYDEKVGVGLSLFYVVGSHRVYL